MREKRAIRDQLQQGSSHEVKSAMVPSATRRGAAQNKGKDKKKMSWMKKAKKHMQKNMKTKRHWGMWPRKS